MNNAGLNGFYSESTGDVPGKAFQGGNPLVLKKELHSGVFSIVVKAQPKTPFFDKVVILCDLSFLQQGSLCRIFHPLLQRSVFLPIGVQVWKAGFEGK
jgi:hypothetical protein